VHVVKNPRVSVIIPVYNRPEQLQRAVQSVCAQKQFHEYELIIVDDGSTPPVHREHLPKVCPQPITIVRSDECCGVSHARNLGVRNSCAPALAFLDSDDQWLPEKLHEQFDWWQQHPHFEILQSQEIWVRNGKRVNAPRHLAKQAGDIFEPSLHRCMITPSSVVMTRRLFEQTGGFNEMLPACEDYDLWLRITARYPVGLVDAYHLRRYAGHSDQLSSLPVLDKYRVRALLDIVRSGELSPEQHTQAVAVLKKKVRIVAGGLQKRGRHKQAESFLRIERLFCS